ncbi:MAG: sulfate reduction electron transfer complex DsrMKJOP subunit DsrJ [Leptospirales bacterium]
MYNKTKVSIGILLFLCLASLPFWHSLMQDGEDSAIKNPVILATAGETCVEDRAFMRSNHMVLLHQWRDEVVRENKREYTNSHGELFQKSLSKTCLGCHSNKKEFCETCHAQASVKVTCFDCHLQPEQMTEKNRQEPYFHKSRGN